MSGMETLFVEHNKLSKKGNLSKSVHDVQKTLDLLKTARDTIATDPHKATTTLVELQNDVKRGFDDVNGDLKDVYNGLSKYSKALDRKFKDKPLPTTDYDALSSQPVLINRAIAMHLLREGQFSVASTFLREVARNPPQPYATLEDKLGLDSVKAEELRERFGKMCYIRHELQIERNLQPAIDWARANSAALDARGSNLEFELGKLQFVWLFLGGADPAGDPQVRYQGQQKALAYAREEFAPFQTRYMKEVQQLLGAITFCPNLQQSPYRRIFCNNDAWNDLANSFTKEFCSLLGLSAESPLYIAATAGAIALPTLLKLQTIMKEKQTKWTTQNELPFEVPLPPAYQFHSIFVCPISKEQTTDDNPPMMMPCGHVIAHESLFRHAKGGRFKCPYCPNESHPKEAKEIFI